LHRRQCVGALRHFLAPLVSLDQPGSGFHRRSSANRTR
jgi:hypothetical protein